MYHNSNKMTREKNSSQIFKGKKLTKSQSENESSKSHYPEQKHKKLV